MANTKISQLTALTNPTWNEEFVYAYNGSNGKITLDTMKTYSTSWSQPTLVSWTNIKTINNQSILWSWNLTVSWASYDCVVDASGNGDYTTINAALTAWENSIFVKNWTYNEWTQLLIKTPTVYIQWESSDWVIVNLEKSSTETTYLWYINFDSTDYTEDLIWVINNITFNAVIWKGSQAYYFVLAETPAVHNNKNIAINSCYINLLSKVANCDICMSQLTASEAYVNSILSFNNCIIKTAAHSSVTPSDVSFRFYTAQETQQSRLQKTVSNDCRFIMEKDWFMNMFIRWTNNNCSYWINWDNSEDLVYMRIQWYNTWCFFDFGWYGTKSIAWVLIWCTLWNYWSWKKDNTKVTAVHNWVSSWAAEWESSHSYSVWDVVRYEWIIYICTEAHTSDSWWLDYNKFSWYLWYTYISKSSRITNSYLWLSGDTIIWDEQSSAPWIWAEEWWFISNNEITVWTWWYIISLWRNIMTWNNISSTMYTVSYDVYATDNCVVNSNFFNFGTAWSVNWVWSNTIISWNILNAYSWTPTCTVTGAQNNIADNNIISTKIFR